MSTYAEINLLQLMLKQNISDELKRALESELEALERALREEAEAEARGKEGK